MVSLFPISKYRLVHKKIEKSDENVINLRADPRPFRYAAYAAKLLFEGKFPEVFLHATGQATSKVVQTVETLRNRITGLHVCYEIKSIEFKDEYHPVEEGLEVVFINRRIHSVHAILTLTEGSKYEKAIGYMKPIEKVFDEEGFKKKVNEHFEKLKVRAERRANPDAPKEVVPEKKQPRDNHDEQGRNARQNKGDRNRDWNAPPYRRNQVRNDQNYYQNKDPKPVVHVQHNRDGEEGRPRPNNTQYRQPRGTSRPHRDDRYERNDGQDYRKPKQLEQQRQPNQQYDRPRRDYQNRLPYNPDRSRRDGGNRNYNQHEQERRYDNYNPRDQGYNTGQAVRRNEQQRDGNYQDSGNRFNRAEQPYYKNSEGRQNRNYDNFSTNQQSERRGRSWRQQSRDVREAPKKQTNTGNFRGDNDQPFKPKTNLSESERKDPKGRSNYEERKQPEQKQRFQERKQ